MVIPFSGLVGPVLNFAVRVNQAFESLASVPLKIVDAVADLPNAETYQGRSVLVRSLGYAATALDGVWLDPTGAPV